MFDPKMPIVKIANLAKSAEYIDHLRKLLSKVRKDKQKLRKETGIIPRDAQKLMQWFVHVEVNGNDWAESRMLQALFSCPMWELYVFIDRTRKLGYIESKQGPSGRKSYYRLKEYTPEER